MPSMSVPNQNTKLICQNTTLLLTKIPWAIKVPSKTAAFLTGKINTQVL